MANKQKVKVVITGYYTIDMDTADEIYGTSTAAEVVAVDRKALELGSADAMDVLDWLDAEPTITLDLEG